MGKIEIIFRYVPDFQGKTYTLVRTLSMETYLSSEENHYLVGSIAKITGECFARDLDIELETEKYNPKRYPRVMPFDYDSKGLGIL